MDAQVNPAQATEITQALQALFVPALSIKLPSLAFAIPDANYMTGAFYQWLAGNLGSQGLSTWSADWECADFARHFADQSQIAHKVAQRASGMFIAPATAVFQFWTTMDTNPNGVTGQHALILIAQRFGNAPDGALTFTAIEPQPDATYRIYSLSPAEFAACTLVT